MDGTVVVAQREKGAQAMEHRWAQHASKRGV